MPLPLIKSKPLPYGGDRKPNDPTPEEIAEACRTMAGVPVWKCAERRVHGKVSTYKGREGIYRDE